MLQSALIVYQSYPDIPQKPLEAMLPIQSPDGNQTWHGATVKNDFPDGPPHVRMHPKPLNSYLGHHKAVVNH